MNVMLVILGFQVGLSYYPLVTPRVMDGFESREACAAAAKQLEAELPRILWPPIPDNVHVPRMRWGCVRLADAVR